MSNRINTIKEMTGSTDLIEQDLGENDLFDGIKLLEAVHHDNIETIKTYLDKNLFTDFVDDEENSLLHHAVIKRNRKSLATLLEHGVNPNQLNSEHLTPLHIAILNKDLKSAKILLKFGADKSLVNSQNQSALDLAQDKHFFEFIEIADKIRVIKNLNENISINYDAFIDDLGSSLKKSSEFDVEKMLDFTLELCDKHLHIPIKDLKKYAKSTKKNIKTLSHKVFSNLTNINKLSETESLKLLRKYFSILNSAFNEKLNADNNLEYSHKLNKVENILEDKIIESSTDIKNIISYSANKKTSISEEKKVVKKLTLKDILKEKIDNAESLSPYHYLDFNNEAIFCRQVNREMCFIDKLTIKTHFPINLNETKAIINSLESDVDKKSVKEAEKIVKDSKNILLLSKSKKFDSILRPGKKHNMHIVYFCKNNDSYENNLDKLSRLSLATGCTVHSFNYPGINHSTGAVDEKRDMIYAGLSTVNLLLEEGIELDRILLISDSESYTVIKNIVKQFLLRERKVSRFGLINLSLEHYSRVFKPTSIRKLLVYYNPNNVDLGLSKETTDDEKHVKDFNNNIFYNEKPDFFEHSKHNHSMSFLMKKFIDVNQKFLSENSSYRNSAKEQEKIDFIIGEIQS